MATGVRAVAGCVLVSREPLLLLDALLCSDTTFQTWEGGEKLGTGRAS